MGFGLLFIGYLFLFSFPFHNFDILPDLIGFLISYMGLKTLADYGCGFDTLKRYFSFLLPVSAITVVMQIVSSFGILTFLATLWGYLHIASILVYNILLLTAIFKIAEDTELKTIKAKAKRNLYLGIIYYGLILFLDFPLEFVEKLKEFLTVNYGIGFVLYIFGYVWMILNISLIFNCYMMICKQGDEDMPMPERKKLFDNKDEEEK